MPWPIPQPTDIFNRAAAAFVAQFPGFQPTEPNTVCGATSRIIGMSGFDLYLYQGYVMQELFPDTSVDELDRQAGIWGLTRIPAQASTGPLAWTATTGATLPTGIVLTDPLGSTFLSTTGGAVGATDTITLTISSATPGAGANWGAGTILTPISPVAGMSATAAVGSAGLSGGAPTETDDALRARLLARIRARGRGGNSADYVAWVQAADSLVAYVQPVPRWLGPGSVGVFIAGLGPSSLGSGDVASVAAYLGAQFAAGGVAPVTAYVTVYLATWQTVNGTVHLVPDTAANRVAAANGFAAWIATTAQIGATEFVDDMDAAIKGQSGGAFSFDRTLPASDVVLGAGTIAVAGTLSFV